MPIIKPFDPWQYQSTVAGSWETLCCPPYDVVSPEEQQALEARNPYNCILLERPLDADPYAGAAARLAAWRKSGVLEQSGTPAFYVYEMTFEANGKEHTLRGFTGRCALTPFEEGQVLPHEETLSKAKADRLALMQATHCNFSPIYALYRDPEQVVPGVLAAEIANTVPESFTMADGVIHRFWRITDPAQQARITDFFANRQVFIADGHHRYETAVNYRNSLRDAGENISPDHPANYIMMTLVDMENEGLVVFPTHRVVTACPPQALSKLQAAMALVCEADSCTVSEIPQKLLEKEGAIALYASGTVTLFTPRSPDVMAAVLPDASDAYRSLDVAVLHKLMLEPHFGIDKQALLEQRNLIYTRDWEQAIGMVDEKQGECAFLLSPTRVSQIRDVSLAGEKMPQKSTYFYPKLITGLYFNGLE